MAQPRTIGPYRILKPIGQGGMGVVYLAMHRETTERVALKTVRVPETAMLATLRREIHALARLDHPRIVKVVADGVEDGVPWYAMELLDGTSLADYIQSVFVAFEDERWDPTSTEGTDPLEGASARTDRTVALPPPERITGEVTATPPPPGGARVEAAGGELVAALTIARRLCDPLAYLHGEGIVHRDLKPANILIKADGAPVLVDFGLTASFTGEESRDHVEVAGMISGTAAYMAPEQARGQIVDARADLYSLGCILYELLCGQPPFLGDHPASLVHQHVNTIPRPPSARASGVPAALDALLMRLLAKDPRDRHGYAVDVARALEEMGARPGASPGPPPRVYLHRPGLAGREDVESALLGRLRRVQEGHGGLQLLAGPAGTGKTRIAAEIASRARARHMRVIPCAADEALRAAPFHLLRPVLQAIADERRLGGDAATRLVASDTGVLADYEPSLAEPPGPARATRPSLSAEQGKLRVFDALSAALSSMTGRGSVVLVMDDVQWADDLSLAYLDHVVRTGALASARVLLLATYRGEEAGAAIRTMRDLGAPCLDLGPLDLGAVGAMVRDMLALPSAGAAFASFLYRQSEGNPLFVAEYLRHAVLEGILTRDATGVWRFEGGAGMDAPSFEGIRLPGSLRQLLGRRMAGLGGAARELLEIVSVMGRGADAALLAPTSGLDEVVFLELLADLARRNVLRADGPNIEIAHERLREIALAGLPHEKRRAIHAAIAQAMEAVTEPERSMRLPDVARHWEGAGELDRARATYLACARSAERRYAIEEAGRLYRQYLALADAATEEAVGARLELWYAVLRLLGPLDEAETHLRRIVDDARVLGLPRREAEGLGGLGVVLGHVGRSGEAVASFEAALAIARASDERMFEGVLCGNFGGLLSRLGRGDEARPLFERQREIHRALGQAESEAMAIASMAHLELASGDLPRARDLYDEALGILRGSGARQYEGMVLGGLAALHERAGEVEEARLTYEEALAIHREVGNRGHEGVALGNLARLAVAHGIPREAEPLYAKALAIHRATGNRLAEASLMRQLAELFSILGQAEDARHACERASALSRSLSDRGGEARATATLAATHLESGRLGEARDAYESVLAAGREIPDVDLEAAALEGLSEVLAESGDLAAAREMHRGALTIRETQGGVALAGALGWAAWLERAAPDAAALLERAEGLLGRSIEGPSAIRALCAIGRARVALGMPAGACATRAATLARDLDLPAESPLARAVASLARDGRPDGS